MKRFIMSMFLLLSISMFVNAESMSYTDVVDVNGKYGSTFTIWVGTVAYEVIDNAYSNAYMCYNFRNIGTLGVWYDFDITVSTGLSGQTVSPNGYITGENGYLPANASITVNGKTGSSIYFKGSDSTTGTKINVTIFKRNSEGQ